MPALTTEAFLATLQRFIAQPGKFYMIWSDHGTNFVGAARELIDVRKFHSQRFSDWGTLTTILEPCSCSTCRGPQGLLMNKFILASDRFSACAMFLSV